MFDAPREMESLIEERFGKAVARITLLAAVSAVVGGAFLVLVNIAAWIKKHVVEQMTGLSFPQPSSWTDIALSLAIMATMFGVAVYLFRRWFRGWENRLLYALGEFMEKRAELESPHPRIDLLFGRVELIEKRLGIDSRAAAMESLLEATPSASRKALLPPSQDG